MNGRERKSYKTTAFITICISISWTSKRESRSGYSVKKEGALMNQLVLLGIFVLHAVFNIPFKNLRWFKEYDRLSRHSAIHHKHCLSTTWIDRVPDKLLLYGLSLSRYSWNIFSFSVYFILTILHICIFLWRNVEDLGKKSMTVTTLSSFYVTWWYFCYLFAHFSRSQFAERLSF